MSCNGDAHAKNFSILQEPDGEWVASPAYDLPSSQPYGDNTMALPIDGRDRQDIGRRHFIALGAAIGVRERAVAGVLDRLLAAAPSWLAQLDGLPFDARRIHRLRRAVAYRVGRLG